jgi:hypothetical protein
VYTHIVIDGIWDQRCLEEVEKLAKLDSGVSNNHGSLTLPSFFSKMRLDIILNSHFS